MKVSKPKQVRFAETNSFLAPPEGFTIHGPARASSASLVGPFTPPMYVASPYGAPEPGLPIRAPPASRRASMPAPASLGTRIHPALEHRFGDPPLLRYDLVDPPSGSALSLRSRDVVRSLTHALEEPATNPPMSLLSISCPHLPWTIRVSSHPSVGYVTVNDVLATIYHALRKQLTPGEYALLERERDRDRAAEAYRQRYRRLRDGHAYDDEKMGGMRRVDFLMERTRFGGLFRSVSSYGEEGWTMSIMK